LAAELVNRYRIDRSPIPAIALTTDTSILTSVSNDADFRYVFSRQIEALGNRRDLVLAITTSGNSANVLEGIEQAKRMGIRTLALTGGDGGRAKDLADLTVCVSGSDQTPRVQETLLVVEHLLCEWVESALFSSLNSANPKDGRTRERHESKDD
jgi:D-sedoheptulose 7-phosphate isomerase